MSRVNTRPSCEYYGVNYCLLGQEELACDARRCGRIADEERFDYEHELVGACMQVATAMACYVERLGQRKAKGAGNERGAPDALLYCAGKVVPLEFKRFRDGRLGLDQIAAIEKRQAQRVETHVVRRVEDFVAAVNGCRRRP
jgi:hypothetical protein